MRCPVDKEAMKEVQAYDTFLDVCPKCLGVWFDMAELQKMTEKLAFGIVDNAIVGVEKSEREEKKFFWQEDSIECPRDYSKMFKRDYAGDSKIHIDYCNSCGGFWIDGDEIKRLENYMKPDPVMDLLGHAVLEGINEREEWKRQVAMLPIELGMMLASPKYLLLRIIKALVDAGIAALKKI